ncbi:MAG: hypothetical protein KAT46_01205 [Deltaproteobacteria bacterium]|nr:hypothetical protein [Deltaproteobacteria bacterium]
MDISQSTEDIINICLFIGSVALFIYTGRWIKPKTEEGKNNNTPKKNNGKKKKSKP